MEERQDLYIFRTGAAIVLYAFTEQSVFLQLLLYRLYPYFCWQLHYLGVFIYIITRIFSSIAVFYVWSQWQMDPFIEDIFKNSKNSNQYPIYLTVFFVTLIGNIILNLTQYMSISALIHISKSVKKNDKMQKEFKNKPRMKELYDIFISFDIDGTPGFDVKEFRAFIRSMKLMVPRPEIELLWISLGMYDTLLLYTLYFVTSQNDSKLSLSVCVFRL